MSATTLLSKARPARGALQPARRRAFGQAVPVRPGFTLIELLLTLTLIAILASIATQRLAGARRAAQNARAVAEIRMLSAEIAQYEATVGALPATLADISRAGLRDPWGRPYVYLNFGGTIARKPPAPNGGGGGGNGGGGNGGGGGVNLGQVRKDKNLVPLNSRYDLYSMGEDGQSQPPLTAKVSRDDIIRANDGGYIGLAVNY